MEKSTVASLTQDLKREALRRGFIACGIARADALDTERTHLENWLDSGQNGSMRWMANHFEKRTDPRLLVEGARSIVSVLENYYHPYQASPDPETGRISRYAWGDDYHKVMREKLNGLLEWLVENTENTEGRCFVDSAPVMDKAWAARAGLGWLGKHSNLIHPDHGSWFFIGELIVSTELAPDRPVADHCGSCTRCIDACPTDALSVPYTVDANRCISYLTIENREETIDARLGPFLDNWIFGCDICQDVCPWNKFRSNSAEGRYAPRPGVLDTTLNAWAEMDQTSFSQRFRKSAVKRTKYSGFSRNVRLAQTNAAARESRRQQPEEKS